AKVRQHMSSRMSRSYTRPLAADVGSLSGSERPSPTTGRLDPVIDHDLDHGFVELRGQPLEQLGLDPADARTRMSRDDHLVDVVPAKLVLDPGDRIDGIPDMTLGDQALAASGEQDRLQPAARLLGLAAYGR